MMDIKYEISVQLSIISGSATISVYPKLIVTARIIVDATDCMMKYIDKDISQSKFMIVQLRDIIDAGIRSGEVEIWEEWKEKCEKYDGWVYWQ